MRTAWRLPLALGVITTMVAVFAPTAAQAGVPNPPPHDKGVLQTAPLKRVGVNHEVAERNGFEVRVDDNGVEYAVKKGEVTTYNTVQGECGSSFFYFGAKDSSRHYTSIVTGFEIRDDWPGAITEDWSIYVIDDYGVTNKPWSDTSKAVHYWAKSHPFTAGGPTYIYGEVSSGLALLWDGTICYSYGPWDEAYL